MKKLFLSVIGMYVSILAAFSQSQDADSSAYRSRKLNFEEANIISSYYSQDGNNAAVTGGIGSEKLTDIANVIDLKLSLYDKRNRKHTFTGEIGIDHYTSASSDKIDPKTISSASHADTRFYPSLGWTMENEKKGTTVGAGISYSSEFDYQSVGVNVNFAQKTQNKNGEFAAKLQAYIESLRRYFAHEESRDEIINDIESRIAELLHEKIRKGASAVTDEDVNEVIASMGTVEDFEAEEKENATAAASSSASSQQTHTESSYEYTRKEKRRLYRDSGDKMIGGVCSGIASYLGIDPAIVRILFAIISFGGFGLGFLAYIILWIVLPPRDLDNFSGKRLYRNPDDKVISGVAGGLAAYFGRSATAIRFIFAAP